MIEVKNLRKAFNGEEVLKGLNFVFDRGKTNLIIGQSGSGKSVFLKNMLGIFTPEEGTIEYDGKPYSEFTDEERRELRKEIGMVFQGGALFDSMTVKENVMFPTSYPMTPLTLADTSISLLNPILMTVENFLSVTPWPKLHKH